MRVTLPSHPSQTPSTSRADMNPVTRDFAQVPRARTGVEKPGAHGADLADLAGTLLKNGPRKAFPASRRVRVILNHTTIVDTTKAYHVWEHDAYPQYYFPLKELKNCSLVDTKTIKSDGYVRAALVEVTVAPKNGITERKTDRVLRFEEDGSLGVLSGLVRLEFGSMDQYLEEDVPIYVHPRDPFKRIEILQSSRPIEVKVNGTTVAKSAFSTHLLETGLPTRYYLPLGSVDQRVLFKSDLITKCPYKGDAEYYHIVVNGDLIKDLAWYYRLPTHESAGVAGLLCFYNEKVDITLDGELQERPTTWFS